MIEKQIDSLMLESVVKEPELFLQRTGTEVVNVNALTLLGDTNSVQSVKSRTAIPSNSSL